VSYMQGLGEMGPEYIHEANMCRCWVWVVVDIQLGAFSTFVNMVLNVEIWPGNTELKNHQHKSDDLIAYTTLTMFSFLSHLLLLLMYPLVSSSRLATFISILVPESASETAQLRKKLISRLTGKEWKTANDFIRVWLWKEGNK
jgi:hypothetical protein